MEYKGGTLEAQTCISQLQALGALVDVYSHEWLDLNPKFPHFTKNELVEYQKRSRNACEGHLLIISTSLDELASSSLLTAAHKPFGEILDQSLNTLKPDLVFINLATQQILCAGLGRKNYFFGFAVGDDRVSLHDEDIRNIDRWIAGTESNELHKPLDPTHAFVREFVKYDYAGVVSSLLESLYEFGTYARNWDYLPLNPEDIESIINTGPDSNGLYDIDDELKTLAEANEILAEFEETDDMGNDNLMTIQWFFPELTWGDLNTQAY